ncbi:hypothetical protein EOD39_9542 [Acipenser ruthenus]|uniref:Uncharacterized protein n=1 Tax=Acipenser ruthenus TaxID=7906 RepID=A0A444U0F3_ACIRT|nr:hypothetical protein EOD39_9542 [Acipenser ruthenus]
MIINSIGPAIDLSAFDALAPATQNNGSTAKNNQVAVLGSVAQSDTSESPAPAAPATDQVTVPEPWGLKHWGGVGGARSSSIKRDCCWFIASSQKMKRRI